jgi:methionine--tRNA ligase beta chain
VDKFELQGGANVAIQAFRDVNRYLQEEAPWLKKGDEHAEFRQVVVRAALEAIYALSHLLLPFVPVGANKIFQKLGKEPVALKDLNRECRNLEVGTKIQIGQVLYEKVRSFVEISWQVLWIKAHYPPLISFLFSQNLSEEEIKDAQGASAKKKESFEDAQLRKKEKKAKEIAASKKGQQAAPGSNQPEFTKIDIRVGKIIKVWNHETADKLFCEQVDLGEETGPREIASGLKEHYTLEEMQDREVLVVCNLKAAKIVGFVSNGMVLAAKVRRGYFIGVESAEEPRLIYPIVQFFREKTGRRSNLSHLLQVLRSEREYLSRG